ncbi:hypothetical protein P154DRAFT_547327 [Amniculicola lignicola CBS 123094]|uniref:C2H2-type domain-containing protein n=1 Tax=Amniculicola lignicola CBS 123094 TaxID=1392246 RepID=A0A6A5WIL7_9PLEO|nr:hypothetical protein P154DRAFT_547327 [Amniculicola lignicola CBS 123094]
MQALPQRRQHTAHSTTTLPSPPTSQSQLNFDQLSQQLSAQDFFNQKLLHDYLESQQQPLATPTATSAPFMTGAFDFANPSIRIQQSTPTPQLSSTYAHSTLLPTRNATASDMDWNVYATSNQTLHSQAQSRTGPSHQRASSSSSIGSSNGSHYHTVGPATGYAYVAHSENSPPLPTLVVDSSYSADEPSRAFSNHHLPTPTHTPIQDSFMSNTFNTYTPTSSGMDSTMAAHFSMKHALMDQHVPDEDAPGFGHSARHSVSSYGHDSPATPHTAHSEELDQQFKMPPSGETLHKVDSWLFNQFLTYDDRPDLRHQTTVPKFDRTYTDAAVDNFYDPTVMTLNTHTLPQGKPSTSNASLLSPYRHSTNSNDIVQRTLQAAQNARSHSPSTSMSRGVSPFRQNSPFRQPNGSYNSPRMRVGTAAQAREQKIEADAAYAMKSKMQSSEDAQPKTISPKDALLDYREADEEAKVPLFSDGGASEYEHQYSGGDQYRNAATQPSFDTPSAQSYRRDNWAPQYAPNFSTSTAGPTTSTSSFAFVPPAISGNMHGLPFTTSQYRTSNNNMPTASDPIPDFPAHLTSMESSASEAGPESASQSNEYLQKPTSSSADTGTYTCTYHGCTLRFETPQKLQKHKREGHRNANPGMTSPTVIDRNSQAGPHKCERINPTTGKPCNTIFSRPYDLTRHEDTIHNARKQKVRCALCVEEKTFSRNDALTRHMRVVHPEVDFPGKHRRRGGNHD